MSFIFFLRLPALLFGLILISLLDLKNIKKERDTLTQALIKKTRELKLATAERTDHMIKPGPRDQIHELIEYLDDNFTESYDRKGLAARFGLNEDYMGQIFKKVTDKNIAHYINTRRIEAAKQLLVETDSKVIDIAFHVGFDNLTYFYRQFKKLTGETPTDFKRTMKNRQDYAEKLNSEDESY
jgi:two-component system response regulator YesN